ncbi:MAG: lysophospholipase [Actinomycetota bacterium]
MMTRLDLTGSQGALVAHRWDPPGPPTHVVVLVHGYAEHGRRYAHVAEVLTAGGAVVFAPDHQGHGLSDGQRAYIEEFEDVVDDLAVVVDVAEAAHPGLPVVMIGHSMGGLLTGRFAQRHRGRLAGAGFLGAVIGDWDWAREVLALPDLPPADSDPSGMSRDPEACREYAEDPLVYHGTYHRRLLEAEVECLDRYAADVDRLDLPVLFLHGSEDPFVPWQTSRAAVEAMPSDDKELHVYEGARHELVNETNRAEVIARIAAWVARVTS